MRIDDLTRIEIGMDINIPHAYMVFLTDVSNGAELNQFVLYPGMLEEETKNTLKF